MGGVSTVDQSACTLHISTVQDVCIKYVIYTYPMCSFCSKDKATIITTQKRRTNIPMQTKRIYKNIFIYKKNLMSKKYPYRWLMFLFENGFGM